MVWRKCLLSLCASKQIGDKPNIQWLLSFPRNCAIWLHLQRYRIDWPKKSKKFPSLFWLTCFTLLKCAMLVCRFRPLPFFCKVALPLIFYRIIKAKGRQVLWAHYPMHLFTRMCGSLISLNARTISMSCLLLCFHMQEYPC